MMNLPFKLRKQQGYCTPKGPSFERARPIRFAIDDTLIQFTAPKHRTKYKSNEARHPKSAYQLEKMIFRADSLDFVLDESWKGFSPLYRAWAFYGDWFTGPLCEMTMSSSIITPASPQPGVSFFHPRAFEQAIADYLTTQYSKHIFKGLSDYIAPVNWSPIDSLPCVAAYAEVAPNPKLSWGDKKKKYLFFPITDQHLVYIVFQPSRFLNLSIEELDKRVDPQPMEDLMHNIINSIQLTLSPEAQAQQSKALEDLEDTSLKKEFPPLKWTTPEQDAEWIAYQKVVTGA